METEAHIVHVKRGPGRPRIEGGTEAQKQQRARWRKAKQIELDETAKYEKLAVRNANLRDEILGTVCPITGDTENLELHHLKPSDSTTWAKRCLNIKSTCAPEQIAIELRKCVRIARREHTRIHSRVNAEIRAIKKHTELTKKGERGLRDYYTEKYTRQTIIIAELKRT